MKQLTITATAREQEGTSASKKLRREGKVPAIVYGKSTEPVNLTVDARDLRVTLKEIGNSTPIVTLDDGSKKRLSIIEEVQRHPIKDNYLHVDFHEVAENDIVSMTVPVHPEGEADGVRNEGGTLEVVSHEVHVSCTAKNAPSFIAVDVTELTLGELIHIKELPELEGVKYTGNPDQPVITVVK